MTKNQRKQDQLITHYNNLATLFTMLGGKTLAGKVLTGRQLSLKLFKLETEVHKAALDYCNGEIQGTQFTVISDRVQKEVKEMLPGINGFFVNSDPRGYALKINANVLKLEKYPLHRDFGGYGILSPEINGN